MSKVNLTASEMLEEIERAGHALDNARSELVRADSAVTAAVNRFNELTRAFDDHVRNLLKTAPNGTDWAKRRLDSSG